MSMHGCDCVMCVERDARLEAAEATIERLGALGDAVVDNLTVRISRCPICRDRVRRTADDTVAAWRKERAELEGE